MNKPSKEEVQEAIAALYNMHFDLKLRSDSKECRLIMSILTAYRDGELVEKKGLVEKLDFELSLLPAKKYGDDFEEGIGIGLEKALEYLNTPPTEPSNETK